MAEPTQEELEMLQLEAEAEAEAARNKNAALEAEIKASGPRNVSGSPDDRQALNDQTGKYLPQQSHYSDKILPEGTPDIVRGSAHVIEDTLNPGPRMLGLAKGGVNAGIGALQTANAVGHSIGAGLGRAYDAVAPSVGLSPRDPESVKAASEQANKEQKFFEDNTLKPSTQEERVLMPVGQIGANIAAGGGVAGAVKSAVAPTVGRLGGYLAGAAAGGVTAAASMPEQEGFLVRSDGLVGFKINDDDDAATQQTKKFMNQSIDNMALGVVGDRALAGAIRLKDYVKTLNSSFNIWNKLPKITQDLGEDIIRLYGGLGPNPTSKELTEAGRKAISTIDQYGDEALDFGEAGTKTLKKDTVSTLSEGLDDSIPEQRAIKTELEAMRASAKRGEAPRTDIQLQQPKELLNKGLQESQAIRGGDTAIDQTRQNLQTRALQQAEQADAGVTLAKEDLAKQSSDYTDVLKKDETFAPIVKKAEESGVPLDIHETERGLKSQIVTKSNAAHDADKALRDAAYNRVAESRAPAKMDEFQAVFDKVQDELPDNIKKLVEKADGSYGYLYKEVRPRLSDAIGAAYKNKSDASALMALKKNIDVDQIAWLTENGNEQTIKAAKEAAKANAEYSAKWGDTIGAELRSNKINNKWAPGRMQEQGRDIVEGAISNPNRLESVENLKNILGPDEGLVPDLAITKATKDITAGKGANIEKITSDLQTMANSFGPQQKARLEGFLTDLRDKKISLDELQAKIPELEKAAEIEKGEIFGERFPDLFEKVGLKQIPKGNGFDVFEGALKNQEPRKIEALIAEAQKTPGDIEGLKTAWLKSAEKQVNQNSKSVGKFDEQFLEYGRKMFGKDSPEVKTIAGLREYAAKLEGSLNRPGLAGLDAKQYQTMFRHAVSTIQTWVFGVLNPTAAKINKVTASLAETYNTTSKAHQAIDALLADNQELKKAAENMIKKYQHQLSPAAWKQLWQAGARIGLYNIRPTEKLNFQTEQAFQK